MDEDDVAAGTCDCCGREHTFVHVDTNLGRTDSYCGLCWRIGHGDDNVRTCDLATAIWWLYDQLKGEEA